MISQLFLTVFCTFAAATDAGVINFPIYRQHHPKEVFTKRSQLEPNKLNNAQFYYTLDCKIGTPPQDVRLLIDTGSSDTFVLTPDVSVCKRGQCVPQSTFEPGKSTTFKSNGTLFKQGYASGSTVQGTWAQDELSIGSTIKFPNFNFAVASKASTGYAILGIGLPFGESSTYPDGSTRYENLPFQLKTHGFISHVCYSIWLSSYQDMSGSILFGGYDSAAYEGEIYRFRMVHMDEGAPVNRLAIRLQSLFFYDENNKRQKFVESSLPVVFDTGSTLSVLPREIIDVIADVLGAEFNGNMHLVKCDDIANKNWSIGFSFGGVEYVLNMKDFMHQMATVSDGTNLCSFGFTPGPFPIFGENLLKNFYVIYDLENKEMAVAKAKKGPLSTTSYHAITTGVPGIKAPAYDYKFARVYAFQKKPITLSPPTPTN